MNEFVNPQHRGVNLPPGYKDLMDVLEAKENSDTNKNPLETGKTRVTQGGLVDIEQQVGDVVESKAGASMLGILPHRREAVKFYLLRKKKDFTAVFVFSEKDTVFEKIVREVFTERGITPILDDSAPKIEAQIEAHVDPLFIARIAVGNCNDCLRDTST